MSSIKVLITGAGGFLGWYISRDLLKKGYEVHSFSRNHYASLEKLGVKQHLGDLRNFNEVLIALSGIDAVIHTASLVGMWGEYKDFYDINVRGTQNVIEACLNQNISKLVYTSTPSVVYGTQELRGVDESQPYPEKYVSYYAETKSIAEKLVLKANGENLATTALRPHLIFGHGDLNLIPKVIEAHRKGKLKIIGDGNNLVDVTYVENASHAHLLALEKLNFQSINSGKAYFVGQGPIKLWDFTNKILTKSQLPPLKNKISLKKAYLIGSLIELFLKITKIKIATPPMTRFMALQLGTSHYFNHANLENDLNYVPLYTIEEGLEILFNKTNTLNK